LDKQQYPGGEQGIGEQELYPGITEEPCAHVPAEPMIEQIPRPGSQQTSRAQTVGVHEVPLGYIPPGQGACGPTTAHAPVVARQQTNVGHTCAVHAVIAPREFAPAGQVLAGPTKVHEPVTGLQQNSRTHVCDWHTGVVPTATLPEGHADPPVTVHTPVVRLQHADPGHGVGAQPDPMPSSTIPVPHE
jgi:hypothetical protein